MEQQDVRNQHPRVPQSLFCHWRDITRERTSALDHAFYILLPISPVPAERDITTTSCFHSKYIPLKEFIATHLRQTWFYAFLSLEVTMFLLKFLYLPHSQYLFFIEEATTRSPTSKSHSKHEPWTLLFLTPTVFHYIIEKIKSNLVQPKISNPGEYTSPYWTDSSVFQTAVCHKEQTPGQIWLLLYDWELASSLDEVGTWVTVVGEGSSGRPGVTV